MCLKLCKNIAKVVKPALVRCLKLFEYEWRPRIPLLVDFIRGDDRAGQFVRALGALILALFDLLLCGIHILGQSRKIVLNARHCLHFSIPGAVFPQPPFHILFDFDREGLVRCGERFGGVGDALPGDLEDTGDSVRDSTFQSFRRKQRLPECSIVSLWSMRELAQTLGVCFLHATSFLRG